jgi:hypothetical protein
MADMIAVEVEGLSELVAKARDNGTLLGKPIRVLFTKASLAVQKYGREFAPVDRGQLRSGISYDVDGAAIPEWAEIGPLAKHGAAVEFGIGDFNEGPGGLGQRPLPTEGELEGWAHRHGMTAHHIWKIIHNRGGIRPVRYMRDGFQAAMPDIDNHVKECASDIEEEWRRD